MKVLCLLNCDKNNTALDRPEFIDSESQQDNLLAKLKGFSEAEHKSFKFIYGCRFILLDYVEIVENEPMTLRLM